MPKEAVFTMKLEPELRDAFMAAAAKVDRPASQVVRELMRNYVEEQKEKREYEEFVRRKVAKAMKSVEAGIGRSNEEVNADFARRRAERRRTSGEAA
jgi:predicted transcriptional regulator